MHVHLLLCVWLCVCSTLHRKEAVACLTDCMCHSLLCIAVCVSVSSQAAQSRDGLWPWLPPLCILLLADSVWSEGGLCHYGVRHTMAAVCSYCVTNIPSGCQAMGRLKWEIMLPGSSVSQYDIRKWYVWMCTSVRGHICYVTTHTHSRKLLCVINI